MQRLPLPMFPLLAFVQLSAAAKPNIVPIDFSDFLAPLSEIAGSGTEQLTLDGRSFLPQTHEQKGTPRDYAYRWNKRDMKAG